jgi:succinate dehydrogenase / fumarate reductase cytochrome b subunit
MAYPRPLSPHLQIYRWQITSVLSILHRITGLALAVGLWVLVGWIVATALGKHIYGVFSYPFTQWYGRILLIGWSFCLFFHLGNGIRHLFWDYGYGFNLPTVHRTGWAVVIAAALITVGCWVFFFYKGGL